MQIDILTLFPEMFTAINTSILKRAQEKGAIKINLVDFRNYTQSKTRRVDDTPYGGGAGMILSCQPIVDCIEDIDPKHDAHRIFLTPAAPVLTQKRAVEIAGYNRIILLCGHYEGVDKRAIDLCFDETLSIGKYVLTGGELPAMVLVDAVSRYVDGVINTESLQDESYSNGDILEYPQYTRPSEYRGKRVPEVLLNGNHAEIKKWQDANRVKIDE